MRSTKMFLQGTVLFISLLSKVAFGGEEQVGFVKQGAFVVPSEVNAKLRSHQTRLRVGYLPTGTVVWIGDCKFLNEKASLGLSIEKEYCFANSEVGVSGLIRRDLVHLLSTPVVVALANEEIPVYPQSGGKPYSNFSRNSGIYVEVTGPMVNGEIPIIRHYTKPRPIPGILKVNQLGDKIRYIDPNNLTVEKANFQNLTSYSENQISSQFGNEIASYFSNIMAAAEKLEDSLKSTQNSLCLVEGEVFAEAGVSFFGSGAGARIAATLKQSGETFGFDATLLTIGSNRHLVSSISRYSCTSPPGAVPEWLKEFLSIGSPQSNPNDFYE
ncbi:hypothetical protein ACGRH2_15170 [Vibrio barjaei]|uniref:Uncharacterized protein n=1 Tax=Vibrio barjaei TaxID=1676683 RepID=A0ABW7IJD9_9VIBR